MKNSPLSAVVLVGIASVVGGIAYFASGQERIEGEARPVNAPVVTRPTVVSVTPYEKKLERKMQQAEEKIAAYRKEGRVLPSGDIKVRDVDGKALYIHPEIIEGVGRFGEPFFATVQYKYRGGAPRLNGDNLMLPPKLQPKAVRKPGMTLTTVQTPNGSPDMDKFKKGNGKQGKKKGGKKADKVDG